MNANAIRTDPREDRTSSSAPKTAAHVAATALIVTVPFIYWVYVSLTVVRFPFQAYDPEYAYFLSALAPFVGGRYTYVQHPGTPLEMIGTAVLWILRSWAGGTRAQFVLASLEDPRPFLTSVHAFLLVCSVASALLLYHTARTSRRSWDSLVAVSVALMFYVLHPASLVTLTYWSHNSLSFALGTVLLLLLYRAVGEHAHFPSIKLLVVGIGMGLLTAVAVYFFAWVIGALIAIVLICRSDRIDWKVAAAIMVGFLVSSAVGFVLGNLPVLDAAPAFFAWLAAMLLHQGRYGSGAAGFIAPSGLIANFADLFSSHQVLFLSTAILAVLIAYTLAKRRAQFRAEARIWAYVAGLLAAILFSLILILKEPGGYYLLSIAALLPPLAFSARSLLEAGRLRRLFEGALVLGVGVGLVVSLFGAIGVQRDRMRNISAAADQIDHVMRERAAVTGRQPQDLVMVWAYGVYNECNALVRINDNYIGLFNIELSHMCPHQYILNDTFISEPVALASDGSKADLNAFYWDFIVIRERTAENVISLLTARIAMQDLGGAKTGLPGYPLLESLSALSKVP